MNKSLSLKKEEEIVSECKEDTRKFGALYRKYVNDVFRYVYVIVKSKEIAEDITAQTFLTGIEKIKDFEWRSISIKYWFLKIARNLMYKQFSKQKDVSFNEEIEIKNLDKILMEDIVIKEELAKKLKELVLKLDVATREVVTLRIWEDMKFKEIAELLEMKEATVKSKFQRGIAKIKQMIEDEKKDMKLRSVSLVSIIIGIKYLQKMSEFKPSRGFLDYLSTKNNLFIKNTTMDNQGLIQRITSLVENFTGGSGMKLAAAALGITGIGVLGIAGYFILENQKEESAESVATEGGNDENITSEQENEEISAEAVSEADLSITATASKDPTVVNSPLDFNIVIVNNGPTTSQNIEFGFTQESDMAVISADPTVSSCGIGERVNCNFETLDNGQSINITISVRPLVARTYSMLFRVTSETSDPDTTNNEYILWLVVNPPAPTKADLALSAVISPASPSVNASTTMTMTIKNLGPGTSQGIRFNFTPESDMEIVSVTPTLGTCTTGYRIGCNIASMNSGQSMNIVIVAKPLVARMYSMWYRVESDTTDPNSANNDVYKSFTSV